MLQEKKRKRKTFSSPRAVYQSVTEDTQVKMYLFIMVTYLKRSPCKKKGGEGEINTHDTRVVKATANGREGTKC